MKLPKDWLQKDDWLDRAVEPSTLGAKEWILIFGSLVSSGAAIYGLLAFFTALR